MSEAEQLANREDIMQAAAQMPQKTANEQMPSAQPVLLASGQFNDADAVHEGSGEGKLYVLPDRSNLVRLENFRVTNGPDLRDYLAKHSSPKQGSDVEDLSFISLGKLKGNVGNQNYAVPAGTDVGQYKSVVIWCELFGGLFSPASLNTT